MAPARHLASPGQKSSAWHPVIHLHCKQQQLEHVSVIELIWFKIRGVRGHRNLGEPWTWPRKSVRGWVGKRQVEQSRKVFAVGQLKGEFLVSASTHLRNSPSTAPVLSLCLLWFIQCFMCYRHCVKFCVFYFMESHSNLWMESLMSFQIRKLRSKDFK